MIIEDISRNINKNKIVKNTTKDMTILPSFSSTKPMSRQIYRKPEGTPSSINKERMRFERESSRSPQNSVRSNNETRLAEPRDLLVTKNKSKSPKSSSTSQRSSKNSNKNPKSQFSNQM